MFNTAFDGITGNTADYCPIELFDEIGQMNARVFEAINSGVYAAAFATAQAAYEDAVGKLFEMLDQLGKVVGRQRYLTGDRLTDADWRIVTSLVRFDHVYPGHFKCNRRRLIDYPNPIEWLHELYQMPGIAATVRFGRIIPHYYASHDWINPSRVVAVRPDVTFDRPTNRENLHANPATQEP